MTRALLSHKGHSGRLRPHEHTLYMPLFIMTVLAGVLLVLASVASYVTAASPGPEAGSVGITGTMPATAPKVAATITTPTNQQHFATSPITVKGTCPLNTVVEVFKNNIFGGSVICSSTGDYELEVDLLFGENKLFAQVYDSLNQAGPPSNTVTVFYDAGPSFGSPLQFLNFGGTQLLLNTDAVYRGSFPGQTMNVPLSIIGGTAPFAINIDWGDSSNKVIPRSDNSTFNATHVYKKAGNYKLVVQASDGQQQVAFLTVAAVINGQGAPVASTTENTSPKQGVVNKLLVLWPLFAILVTMLISFWLGEKREKRIMTELFAKAQNPTLGATPRPTV